MSIYPRTNYEMTEEDLSKILDACKPTLAIKVGGFTGSSPQENANRAWGALGKKMGFDHMTVQPASGGNRFFSAIPSETEEQRTERKRLEAQEEMRAEIEKLECEMAAKQIRLDKLRGDYNGSTN